MNTKTLDIEKQFKRVLASKGLLNPTSGVALAFCEEYEYALLTKWQEAAKAFIYKDQKVGVRMAFKRCLAIDGVWMWPIVYQK